MYIFYYTSFMDVPGAVIVNSIEEGVDFCAYVGASYHRVEDPNGQVVFDAETLSALI